MAGETTDATPIDSMSQLVESFSVGCKPRSKWRIGTEHEKFAFTVDGHSPVPYDGPKGIKALLRGMEGLLGWAPIMDAGNIIGLHDPVGGGAISLEPGGQFELSGAPLVTLHQTCKEVHSHLAQVREIAEPLGVGFLGTGVTPTWSLDDIPRMPKSRYAIMTNYMPKVGTLGLDMMYRTTTIQVNLDFSSEADMVRKMRVSLALQPIATAIFANSPFLDHRPNGFLSYRSETWRHTDPHRSGMIPFVFESGFGFEAYADWALDVPMYFIQRNDAYQDVTGVTFRQFMDGALEHRFPGDRANMGDWNNHLSTLFPEVRLKQFLEMRGADGGPWRRICALPAFWVGLLYDDAALEAAWALVRDWSAQECQELRDQVPKTALATRFRDTDVNTIARKVVEISRDGLKARNHINESGFDESDYLAAVEETVAAGLSPADLMMMRYNGDWAGDIDRIYDDYAY
jgi:glutamate--cysteine ligase